MKFLISVIAILFLGGCSPVDKNSSEYQEWTKKHASELEVNRGYQEIVKGENFHFDRLELIQVSPGKKYYSWWGHLLLHFVGSGEKPEEDLVLSFLADFNDYPVDIWKASFGGYVVMPKLGKLKEYQDEYIMGEDRKMISYFVESTKEQNLKLLNILQEWIKNPSLVGGYSFFYNNCVTLVNQLLLEAHILKVPGLYGYWPRYVPDQYREAGVLR